MPVRWRRQVGTVEKAENINAPVFTDFPMTLECRIKEKIDESPEGYYIVAEIVNILVDEKYLAENGKAQIWRRWNSSCSIPYITATLSLARPVGHAFSDGKALKG